MKLLLVSDEESKYIWDHFDPSAFRGVELIVSCGDLSPQYLDFLATMLPVPLVYVPGNHDKGFVKEPPPGGLSLDGTLLTFNGIRFAGLGGCKSGHACPYEYTEEQMRRRVRALSRSLRRAGGLDVFVSHVSARGLGDGEDAFHQGFECFRALLDEYTPRLHIFGHQHRSYCRGLPTGMYGSTRLVNACGYKILDFDMGSG